MTGARGERMVAVVPPFTQAEHRHPKLISGLVACLEIGAAPAVGHGIYRIAGIIHGHDGEPHNS